MDVKLLEKIMQLSFFYFDIRKLICYYMCKYINIYAHILYYIYNVMNGQSPKAGKGVITINKLTIEK